MNNPSILNAPPLSESGNPLYPGHCPPQSPRILISTPWGVPMVSTGFCTSLRNCLVPFPHTFLPVRSRHVADARNAMCVHAMQNGFTHVFMVDADHQFPEDTFLRLWKILEGYGHDKTVASGWATIKTGPFTGKPCAFRIDSGNVLPIEDIATRTEPFAVDAVGTPGLLFSITLLSHLKPPWFSDIFVIREDQGFEDGPNLTIYHPTEYKQGQDLTFSTRLVNSGCRVIVDPQLNMPHEVVGTI